MKSTDDSRTDNNVMRHQYRVLTDAEKETMQDVKDMALALHDMFCEMGSSRELSSGQDETRRVRDVGREAHNSLMIAI